MTETVVAVGQSLSRVLILCDPMDCSTQGFPVLHHLQGLLKFMSIESVILSNHFIRQRLYDPQNSKYWICLDFSAS